MNFPLKLAQITDAGIRGFNFIDEPCRTVVHHDTKHNEEFLAEIVRRYNEHDTLREQVATLTAERDAAIDNRDAHYTARYAAEADVERLTKERDGLAQNSFCVTAAAIRQHKALTNLLLHGEAGGPCDTVVCECECISWAQEAATDEWVTDAMKAAAAGYARHLAAIETLRAFVVTTPPSWRRDEALEKAGCPIWPLGSKGVDEDGDEVKVTGVHGEFRTVETAEDTKGLVHHSRLKPIAATADYAKKADEVKA